MGNCRVVRGSSFPGKRQSVFSSLQVHSLNPQGNHVEISEVLLTCEGIPH